MPLPCHDCWRLTAAAAAAAAVVVVVVVNLVRAVAKGARLGWTLRISV